MEAAYKTVRNIVSATMALALTSVLVWGIIDAGASALWMSAAAMVGR
jgi:hypothetical protein